jgi:PhnB protein
MNPTLTPYIHFNGDCAEAMKFYQSVLGGKLDSQTYAETGMPTPDPHKQKIIHSYLNNGTLSFMAGDAPPGRKVAIGDNIHMSIVGNDRELLTSIFSRLSEGGSVTMPLAKQFWGDIYGQLRDKFGIHWMVNISSGEPAKPNPDPVK